MVLASAALIVIACESPPRQEIADSLFASSRNVNYRDAKAGVRPDILPLLEDPYVEGLCLVETGFPRIRLDVYISPKGKSHQLPSIRGIEINPIYLDKPLRPLGLKMGTSTGNTMLLRGAGTLGIMAADKSCPAITGYITNNHVATASDGHSHAGPAKIQVAPGFCDSTSCSASLPIGTVLREAPINPKKIVNLDAAFVGSHAVDPENACGLCAVTEKPASPMSLVGHSIRKCGRSTGLTCGTVTGAYCVVRIQYLKEIWFVNQIRVDTKGFAKAGDSGSVAYTDDGRLAGLVFAGDDDRITFLHPMDDVFKALNVTPVLPSCKTQPPCPKENPLTGKGCS